MPTLESASLLPIERAAVLGLVDAGRARFGSRLHAVWLFGSRARGEPPAEDSDIDLIFLIDAPTWEDQKTVVGLAFDVGDAIGFPATRISPLVRSPQWPAQRRAIRDFFIAEVDRDRTTLYEA